MPPYPELVRLRITDDPVAPGGIAEAGRARDKNGQRSRRPHSDARVARVRELIEESTLTYSEIAAKTGVGRASICRWTRDQGWKRPLFAPRATDTIPRARAGQRLKLRLLAERLRALAERHIRELEDAPRVDVERLMRALELLKMARLEAMGRNARRRRTIVLNWMSGARRDEITRKALRELHYAGIDGERLPQEALDLLIDARMPPDDHPALHAPGRRRG